MRLQVFYVAVGLGRCVTSGVTQAQSLAAVAAGSGLDFLLRSGVGLLLLLRGGELVGTGAALFTTLHDGLGGTRVL